MVLILWSGISYSQQIAEQEGVFGITNRMTKEDIEKRFPIHDCKAWLKGSGSYCDLDNYLKVPGSSERYYVSDEFIVKIDEYFFSAIFSDSGIIAQLSMLDGTSVLQTSVSGELSADLAKIFDKKYQKLQAKSSLDTKFVDGLTINRSHKLWKIPKDNIMISLTTSVDRITNPNVFYSKLAVLKGYADRMGNTMAGIVYRSDLESYGSRKVSTLDYFFFPGHAEAVSYYKQIEKKADESRREESKSKLKKF
jgi:hypothetical protein